jgi:hypothetical protein
MLCLHRSHPHPHQRQRKQTKRTRPPPKIFYRTVQDRKKLQTLANKTQFNVYLYNKTIVTVNKQTLVHCYKQSEANESTKQRTETKLQAQESE